MIGAASYAIWPVCGLGDETAEYAMYVLMPRLAAVVVLLYLSSLQLVDRFPVTVYAGDHPVVKKMIRSPSFQRDYRPPSWAVGWLPQAMLYAAKSWWNSHLRGYRRELVQLPDGEHVSLVWMAPKQYDAAIDEYIEAGGSLPEAMAKVIPSDVPVIVVCHGVFQTPADLYEFVKFLTTKCGYLACVFNRRGNDLPLSRPRFNTVGDQQDFRYILTGLLRGRFPYSCFYGVGISAGSSLLARYLGDASDESELEGGVLISPGYDIEQSLQYMNPLLDMALTYNAKSFFLKRNEDVLAERCSQGLNRLYRSRSMHEFHHHQYVFNGKDTSEEYFAEHNPVFVLDKIAKPTVYINAYDDPCFPGTFTFQFRDLVQRCSMAAILHVERGGHATFYENWNAGSSRTYKLVREFVECLQSEQDGGWGKRRDGRNVRLESQ